MLYMIWKEGEQLEIQNQNTESEIAVGHIAYPPNRESEIV